MCKESYRCWLFQNNYRQIACTNSLIYSNFTGLIRYRRENNSVLSLRTFLPGGTISIESIKFPTYLPKAFEFLQTHMNMNKTTSTHWRMQGGGDSRDIQFFFSISCSFREKWLKTPLGLALPPGKWSIRHCHSSGYENY